MRTTSAIVNQKPKNSLQSFIGFINADSTQKSLLRSVGGDQQALARFCATVKAAVTANPNLQNCDAGSIMNAALHGEIALDLSYALGQYGLIPYGDVCTFQLQAKGLEQLCIRSGKYALIKCYDVRQGEYIGCDPQTWEPRFKRIEDDDLRNSLPIIGYYALYKLNEKNNSFFDCVYWTRGQCLKHAERYACGGKFDREKFDRIERGEEAFTNKKDSPWYDVFGGGFEAMCKKTVMKQLLNSGTAPKAIREAIAADNDQEKNDSPAIYDDALFTQPEPTPEPVIEVDAETGEVVSEAENIAAEPVKAEPENVPAPAPRATTRRRTTPTAQNLADGDFFGEDQPMEGGFFND